MKLPADIEATAFRPPNGEYAWRRSDVPAALSGIAACGFVVLGGEAWGVRGSSIWGGLPTADGETGVFHWEVSPRQPGESWAGFVERSVADAHRAISTLAVEDSVTAEWRDHIYYNITFVDENDYSELAARSCMGLTAADLAAR